MNYKKHPILCLYRSNNRPWCHFFDEVLIQEGYLSFDSVELDQTKDLASILEGRILVVIGASELSASEQDILAQYVKNGGNAILLAPPPELIKVLGLPIESRRSKTYNIAPPGYLQFIDHPWVSHHAGQFIQCHAPTSLWKIKGSRPLAWVAPQRGVSTAFPAIIECEIGKGRLTIFWFDPGTSLVLTRQGDPRLASTGQWPDADMDGMHKTGGLFYRHFDYHLRFIPQADILTDVIVGAIRGMTDSCFPLPRVWHLPQNAPALTLLDGDSDGCNWEQYDRLVGPCIEHGIPYTLNVHPDNFKMIDPSISNRIFSLGNDLELHYWSGNNLPSVEEEARCIREQQKIFKEITGGCISVGSRGHSVIWPGYTETAEVLANEGFRLDTSFGILRGVCECGYLTGSNRAARFITTEGRFLPISQQATVFMDDGMFSGDKMLLPPLSCDQAYEYVMRGYSEAVERFHGVMDVCIHPGNDGVADKHPDGQNAIRQAVFDATKKYQLPALTVRDWSAFQEARRQVDLYFEKDRWWLKARSAIRGLTCHFPNQSGSCRQGFHWQSTTHDFSNGEVLAIAGDTK